MKIGWEGALLAGMLGLGGFGCGFFGFGLPVADNALKPAQPALNFVV